MAPERPVTTTRMVIKILLAFLLVITIGMQPSCDILSSSSPPDVTPSSSSIPFGSVVVGQSADRVFNLRNDASSGSAKGTVGVSGAAFSIVSGGGSYALSPGQTRAVTVRFAPTAASSYSGTVSVTQDGNPPKSVALSGIGEACAYTITPSSRAIGVEGGTGSITVTAQPGCTWQATSSANWIAVTSGASGNGNGTVSYSVSANADPSPRSGSISIAGRVFTVTQDPLSVQASVSTSSISFGTVTVGQAKEESFTVSNSSSSNASLSGSVAVSGGGFSFVSGGGSFTLSPGQSKTITIRFSPTSGTGFSGSVSVTHNATNRSSPTTVSLSGQGAAPILMSLSKTSIDFGATTVGQAAEQSFTLSNASASTASLTANVAIVGSGFSFVSGGGSFTLSPGQSRTITIRFSPSAGTSYSGSVSITHNATNQSSPTTVSLSGQGSAPILMSLSKTSIDFGPSTVGQAPEQSFTISNLASSTGPLSGNVAISGGGFSIVSGAGSFNLSPGQSRTVTVRFSPTAVTGYSGSVTITHNATNLSSPSTVTLSGQGSACTYSISPTSRSHAAAGGNGTVGVTAASGCAWTAASNDSWITVTSGASGSGTGTVTYSVAANSSPSARSGTLAIAGKTFTVSQATSDILISFSHTSIDFGTVTVGQSPTRSFTISNSASSTGVLNGSMTLSGSGFSIASGGGSFSLSPGQSRTVTVRFSPSAPASYSGSVSVTHNATNRSSPTTVSLTGQGSGATYTVSGTVRDGAGTGIGGTTISFSGGHSPVTTASNGIWSKSGLSGSITVTPSRSGYTFSPSSRTVTGAASGVDFMGGYLVSGTVRDRFGNGLANVTISFSGGHGLVTTASNGTWSKQWLSGVVTVTASISGWGFNPLSRQVNGSTASANFERRDIMSVGAGAGHSLAAGHDGTVWAWGDNTNGQLGDGTTVGKSAPIRLASLSGAVRIAAGYSHSLALLSNGTVWAWGRNDYGQLGDGTFTRRTAPVQVYGLPNIIQISAGERHSLARAADGTVWAWGRNDYGQLGDGTTVSRAVPVRVQSLTSVSVIVAGANHSLAARSDGSAWAWGLNDYGQLGDGSTTNRTSPVRVRQSVLAYLSDVTWVAAGRRHSLARQSNGDLRAWGHNGDGQLGDGTTTNRLRASAIALTGAGTADGGGRHSLALRTDYSAWAWGLNNFGQIGDGTTTTRTSPTLALLSVGVISGGEFHSLAARRDGSTWAWGYNGYGQLGTAPGSGNRSPQRVVWD